MLCILLLQGQALAQNIEYSFKDYDFSKDQRILVTYEYSVENENYKDFNLEEVLHTRVEKDLATDKKLKKQGKEFLVASDKENIAEGNYDVQLKVIVRNLEDLVVTTPPYSYQVPHTINHYYYGPDGKVYSYTTTWFENVYVPEHNEIRPYCEARFELYELNSGKMIWSRDAARDHGSSGPFTSSQQGFHDTFDYLVKKFFKDYKSKMLKKN